MARTVEDSSEYRKKGRHLWWEEREKNVSTTTLRACNPTSTCTVEPEPKRLEGSDGMRQRNRTSGEGLLYNIADYPPFPELWDRTVGAQDIVCFFFSHAAMMSTGQRGGGGMAAAGWGSMRRSQAPLHSRTSNAKQPPPTEPASQVNCMGEGLGQMRKPREEGLVHLCCHYCARLF